MTMDATPVDEFVGPPAPAGIYAAAQAAETDPFAQLNAALAEAGSKLRASVLASDVTPYHGGKHMIGGKLMGEAGGVMYDVKAGTALTKDAVLNQRYGELSGSASVKVGKGAVGIEASRQVGMALGQMPIAHALEFGGAFAPPKMVDVPQPLQSLSITKYGVVGQLPADALGTPFGLAARAGKVNYTLGGVKSDYSTVSVTALGAVGTAIWDVKAEHGTAGTDGAGFNVASAKLEAVQMLPKDYRLRFAGAAQVGTENTPAPAMFSIAGPDRAASYAYGEKVAPSGVAAGITLVTPALTDADSNVRAYAGVSGGVGTMQDRTSVKASSIEVGVTGQLWQPAARGVIPGTVDWRLGYARALEDNARDKSRLTLGLTTAF